MGGRVNGYKILAVGGDRWPVDLAALGRELAVRGFGFELHATAEGLAVGGSVSGAPCLLLLAAPTGAAETALLVAAAENGVPALVVGRSWVPGRLQIDEIYPKRCRASPHAAPAHMECARRDDYRRPGRGRARQLPGIRAGRDAG